MVDEICRGRWYEKENGQETAIVADLDKLMGSLRYSKDNDMFSIIANRYGRDPSKFKAVQKKDFIALNRQLAKDGGTYKNAVMSQRSSSLGHHAGYNGGMSVPIGGRSSEMSQMNRGGMGRSTSSLEGTHDRRDLTDPPMAEQPIHHQRSAEDLKGFIEKPQPPAAVAPPARPDTAYINSLPMPPRDGEVPPPDRRKKGVYPMDWRPSARVQALKNRLQDILSSKHKHLVVSFRRFDEDHRGTIELAELYRVIVQESGIPCTRKDLEELWDLFDRDRDGVIKYADYAKTMGNDALEERDFFQIAQRKAAGRYNEEVRYFDTGEEQDAAHFLNAGEDQESAIERRDRMARERYLEVRETDGERAMYTCQKNKYGALPHEKRWKKLQTIPGTRAHELRHRLLDAIGRYPREELERRCQEGMNILHFHKLLGALNITTEELTALQLFMTLDYDRDDLIQLDDFDRMTDYNAHYDTWEPEKSVPGVFSVAGKLKQKPQPREGPPMHNGGASLTKTKASTKHVASPIGIAGSVGDLHDRGMLNSSAAGSWGMASTSKEAIMRKAGRLDDIAQRAATPLLRAAEERQRAGPATAPQLSEPEALIARPQKVLQPRGVAWGSRPGSSVSVRRSSTGHHAVSFIPGGDASDALPLPAPPKPIAARPRTAQAMHASGPKHISPKGTVGNRMRPLSAAGVFQMPGSTGFIPQSWDMKNSEVWENHE